MTKIIGLTGGIGSGKSMIAEYFAKKGVPVYIADDEARKIMLTKDVIEAVKMEFGDDVITNDVIDRAKLANIVFNDSEKLNQLNNIIHPAVREHFKTWVESQNDKPFVIKEAAILFESGSAAECDAIITVTAPAELRFERLIKRDNSTKQEIERRMAAQWTDEQRNANSDFVIINISKENTYAQVDEILKKLQYI